jgi:Sulfatase
MRIAWSRAITGAFWFATAAYCLLSAIPFASEQFLKPGLVPALVTFAGWHAWISLAALSGCAAALAPWLRSGHPGARAFVAVWAVAAIVSLLTPPLSQLGPSTAALTLALLSLVPPVWIALMDLAPPHSEPRADAVSRDFAACAFAALVVTLTHALSALPSALPLGARSAGIAGLSSLLLHLVVFSGVFAAICVVRGLSRLISRRDALEAWLARGVVATVLALFLLRVVLRPIALVGVRGAVVAAAFGAALAAAFGPRATGAGPGLEQALSGLVPRWATRSRAAALSWLAVAAIMVWLVERQAATADWNFVVAKSAAGASWLIALAASLRMPPIRATLSRTLRSGVVPFALCFVLLGLNAVAPRVGDPAASAADVWKAHDASIRLITDALAPPASVSDTGLVDFLQRHTNIPRSTRVEPVTIDLAALDGAPDAVRPHIFVFVIDSLRRDYVSPYNHQVTFTPALERFARESTVFERAFTRYGATGLSVPSLWVGGLVLHKQYVTPFAPMNTLAKLLEHEQYAQWISMDNILDVILPPSTRRVPLDADVQVADFRLCRTLGEIRGRLDRLKAGGPPAFVYSLPQDVHVSAITREGAASLDGASYGTFYAPYASRVRRLDACFGEFIDDLKSHGLFDSSLIVVTADHGDSLGEQGRMGHAYTIFPEILQVPLIVHLPLAWAGLHADTSAPAFTTDLTPTLYALLGHEPRPPAAFFGHPLFRKAGAPSSPRSTDPQVVASSYGTVYGALLDDARRLYIFDGIALREYTYELDGTAAGRATAVTGEDRVRGQRAIRETVEAVARLNRYRQ